jgi:quaternary ammonium compound-resistance protein SugE
MAWLLVIIAGLFEVAMALSLKESHGFSRLSWTVAFVVFAITSFGLLSLGLRSLPVGSAYAVWTGIGAAGTAIAGILFFGDPPGVMRLTAISLIICGVVMLQLVGSGA